MVISKQNAKRAGKRFEWQVRDRLQDDGYLLITSAGSMTACDMIAVKPGEILFVQCKAGVAGNGTPGLVSPAERIGLLAFAQCLPGIARAIVAYQVKDGRAHALRWKQLTGVEPSAWRAWTPDQVIGNG